MKDLAPSITRQRLLIETIFTASVNEEFVRSFLLGLAEELDLRVYGDPIIHSPAGDGKTENQGFDAFVPLIDSGIALYVWTNEKFMSCVLYTCKEFSVEKAIAYSKERFEATELVFQKI